MFSSKSYLSAIKNKVETIPVVKKKNKRKNLNAVLIKLFLFCVLICIYFHLFSKMAATNGHPLLLNLSSSKRMRKVFGKLRHAPVIIVFANTCGQGWAGSKMKNKEGLTIVEFAYSLSSFLRIRVKRSPYFTSLHSYEVMNISDYPPKSWPADVHFTDLKRANYLLVCIVPGLQQLMLNLFTFKKFSHRHLQFRVAGQPNLQDERS
jgi:hypothetical protein